MRDPAGARAAKTAVSPTAAAAVTGEETAAVTGGVTVVVTGVVTGEAIEEEEADSADIGL